MAEFRSDIPNVFIHLFLAVLSFSCILQDVKSQSERVETMSQRTSSLDLIQGLQDIETPVGAQLAGIYKRSFAFVTIKDRLPVILTKIVDTLSRDKEEIIKQYGQESADEVKQIIGCISKLKNEVVTNKPIQRLPSVDIENDTNIWNEYLDERTSIDGEVPCWFNTHWLYCECYLYRRLAQEFALTKTLKKYDPFKKQKQDSFTGSMNSIIALSHYTMDLINRTENVSSAERKHEFIKLIKVDLWGNRCDLSLSAGADSNQSGNPVLLLESLEKDILVDESKYVWDLLSKTDKQKDAVIVDIILDNAGYELFTDLCLAAFMVAHGLTQKVRFYVKSRPWYVSDTTVNDFHWLVEQLKTSTNPDLSALGEICANHVQNNIFTVEEESFWTEPYDYAQMKTRDPTLYAKLSDATLAIFKGDLNYRKLTGDINFEYTTSFLQSLRGFTPTNLLSLRTIKSDVCVGLPPGKAESVRAKDKNWLITGQYGLIQATVSSGCPCIQRAC